MRPVIMGRHFSGPLYGHLMGLQFALLALATAGGPLVTGGILRDALGSYALLPSLVVILLLLAVPIILTAEYEGRPQAT
jgi:hypothetical protein